MKTINFESEADVFEYCERRFGELKIQDNGYHPQKHDKIVFENAAKYFKISINEAEEIFDRATKKTAQIYMDQKGKITKDQMLKEMMAIVKENKDFPFRDDNNTELPPVKSHHEIIIDKYSLLAENIGLNGWTIPQKFSFENLDEINKIDIGPENYDSYFNDYFDDIKIKHTVTNIIKTKQFSPAQLKLFEECVESFWEGKYQIVVNALISVLEGCLSELWPDKNNVRMMMICNQYRQQAANQYQPIKELIWISTYNFIKVLYSKSDFDQNEPVNVNRHWILHGRTQMEWERVDCIRLIASIYTVVTLAKKDNSTI